ncbi:hypothetical protein HPB50_004893 [Hyalomma asiaticum]|uniref:Uncharacterized protein n=1 Tax=Hyalomma asiaticum TaxID=266040 RepID=A0ACB7SI71_HYAAI|nr:hypothetical protein HPB50_004893 [Hyalomma asiaticum]
MDGVIESQVNEASDELFLLAWLPAVPRGVTYERAAYGLPPLPPFLETPGDVTIPWEQWRDYFTNFLAATEMDVQPPLRKKAILLQCLRVEGRPYFSHVGPRAGTDARHDKRQDEGK